MIHKEFEILQMAALAAGIEVAVEQQQINTSTSVNVLTHRGRYWNPLSQSQDMLQLIACLDINVEFIIEDGLPTKVRCTPTLHPDCAADQPIDPDKQDAIKVAVVEAAFNVFQSSL